MSTFDEHQLTSLLHHAFYVVPLVTVIVVTQRRLSSSRHQQKNGAWGRFWGCWRPRNRIFWNAFLRWLGWLYLFAFIMMLVERPNELSNNVAKLAEREEWEKALRDLDSSGSGSGSGSGSAGLSPDQVAQVKRLTPLHPDRAPTHNWVFDGAILFVTTVGSTIGYGSFTPVTFTGKLLTWLLAVPSIIFFLKLSNCAGERLIHLYRVHVICHSEQTLRLHYGKMYRAVRLVRERSDMGDEWGPVKLQERFRSMDKNNNGDIDEEELKAAFPTICDAEKNPETALSKEQLHKLVKDADLDLDGKLNYAEAAHALDVLLDTFEDETQAALDIGIMLGGVLVIVAFFVTTGLREYLLFAAEDRWAFLDVVYFQVITATTIGLGDFSPPVPNPANHPSVLLAVEGSSPSDRAVVRSNGVLSRYVLE